MQIKLKFITRRFGMMNLLRSNMEGIQIFVTLKFSERAKKFQINHLLSFDVTE